MSLFTRALASYHFTIIHLVRSRLGTSANPPTNLDQGLTGLLTVGRVVDKISIESDICIFVNVYDSAAAIVEGAKALTAANLATNGDARVVFDAAD